MEGRVEVRVYNDKEEKKYLLRHIVLRVHALSTQIPAGLRDSELNQFVKYIRDVYEILKDDISNEKVIAMEDSWHHAYTSWSNSANSAWRLSVREEMTLVRSELVSKMEFVNFIVNRLDDGQTWSIMLQNNVWKVRLHEGRQSITKDTPMLTAKYESLDSTDHAYVKRMAGSAGAASISMAQKLERLVAQRSLGGVPNANLETLKAGQRMHPKGCHGVRPTTPM
jgi:hypothetical protein